MASSLCIFCPSKTTYLCKQDHTGQGTWSCCVVCAELSSPGAVDTAERLENSHLHGVCPFCNIGKDPIRAVQKDKRLRLQRNLSILPDPVRQVATSAQSTPADSTAEPCRSGTPEPPDEEDDSALLESEPWGSDSDEWAPESEEQQPTPPFTPATVNDPPPAAIATVLPAAAAPAKPSKRRKAKPTDATTEVLPKPPRKKPAPPAVPASAIFSAAPGSALRESLAGHETMLSRFGVQPLEVSIREPVLTANPSPATATAEPQC